MNNYLVPTVIEKENNGERSFDLYSRLLRDRIILLNGEVNPEMSKIIISQLLFLASEDPEADVFLYINSPGGCVHSGLAMFDIMNHIKPDVVTVCMGMAASMGAFLLASGAPGKRQALPNAQIMVHQVSSGTYGHVEDQRIRLEHSMHLNEKLAKIIAKNVGMTIAEYMKHVNRDKWLEPEDALKFGKKGLIDKVI